MRNPIRRKNLNLRFLPIAAIALLALYGAEPVRAGHWTNGLGIGLIVLGLALRSWGAGHLTKRERLTVSGPYAHHRHPLYAGTLLIATGFASLLGGATAWALALLSAAGFFLAYFPRKERRESALLESEFGGAYVVYRASVPALLPRRTAWKPSHAVAKAVPLSSAWSFERWGDNNEHGTLLGVVAGGLLVATVAMRNLA